MKRLMLIWAGVLVLAGMSYAYMRSKDFTKVVIADLTTNNVSPKFTPVLIWKLMPLNGLGAAVGSGTLYFGKQGAQVITAAHVFDESNDKCIFVVQRLRPLEDKMSLQYCIESIDETVLNSVEVRKTGNDLVVCRAGTNMAAPIACFYTKGRAAEESNMEGTFVDARTAPKLTSLVSGKSYPVVAFTKPQPSKLAQYLILKRSICGESGTGFVDSQGRLYVVKGTVSSITIPDEIARQFGISKDADLTAVIGCLSD